MKHIWQKTYKGPFSKKEAEGLVQNLKDVANPDINSIYDAAIRKRRGSNKYDVFIKTIEI